MSRNDHPDAYWDSDKQVPKEWDTGLELPNYQGLILYVWRQGSPAILNTWLEDGERLWQYIGPGSCIDRAAL